MSIVILLVTVAITMLVLQGLVIWPVEILSSLHLPQWMGGLIAIAAIAWLIGDKY